MTKGTPKPAAPRQNVEAKQAVARKPAPKFNAKTLDRKGKGIGETKLDLVGGPPKAKAGKAKGK